MATSQRQARAHLQGFWARILEGPLLMPSAGEGAHSINVIRLDVPDGSDEEALEKFLASLERSARSQVRRMILEGAPEAEIASYIASFEEQLGDEEDTIHEEDESR